MNTTNKVIPVNKYFYTTMIAESFVHCGELQNTHYCYKSNVAQGCMFCEYDSYSPCECAVCEK